MEKLLILGAGQYGCVAREVAASTNRFCQIDFLDDNSPAAIGTLSECERYLGAYDCAFIAIGNPDVRAGYLDRLRGNVQLTPLISPMAYVSPSATLGEACIVEPMAAILANATVGAGCILSAGSVVNHNASVGECCHVDCNATVPARAQVPAHTKVTAGAVFEL